MTEKVGDEMTDSGVLQEIADLHKRVGELEMLVKQLMLMNGIKLDSNDRET